MPSTIPLTSHVPLPEKERVALAAQVVHQHTLHDVIAWMTTARPTPSIVAVIDQDEFTNDVVVRLSPERFLVYDST